MQRRTNTQSAKTPRWLWGAALLGLLVMACNPSPHFDPLEPAGSGGSGGAGASTTTAGGAGAGGSTTSSSGGGGSSAGCKSNADCSYPNNLCDVASGDCVECIVSEDCGAKLGTVCSKAACVCPVTGDTFCPTDGYGSERCVDLDTNGADCGACGHKCFGSCTAGACTDAWEPTALAGAPTARTGHVAVWTGSMMIVWGGSNGGGTYYGDGAEYDPDARTWTSISTVDAPSPRDRATAVWTGSEMIVWGGRGPGGPLGDGASYNPAMKKWVSLPVGGPLPRYDHTAVWTGAPTNRMFVWGGFDGGTRFDTGAYFAGGSWSDVSIPNLPTARHLHTTVWDDMSSRVIVFGGFGPDPISGVPTSLGTGGIYGPLAVNETWTELSLVGNAPSARYEHSAVWAGTHMIVWGGYSDVFGLLNDGALFDVIGQNEWSMIDGVAPSARRRQSAVYFKNLNKMVVWGGIGGAGGALGDGGLFDVAAGAWSPNGLPKGPGASVDHTAVVAGSRMIVWGGTTAGGGPTAEGAVLDMAKVP
jgi:hypothetical protein